MWLSFLRCWFKAFDFCDMKVFQSNEKKTTENKWKFSKLEARESKKENACCETEKSDKNRYFSACWTRNFSERSRREISLALNFHSLFQRIFQKNCQWWLLITDWQWAFCFFRSTQFHTVLSFSFHSCFICIATSSARSSANNVDINNN